MFFTAILRYTENKITSYLVNKITSYLDHAGVA